MFVAAESSRYFTGLEPIEAVRRGIHFRLASEMVAFGNQARLKWKLAVMNKRR